MSTTTESENIDEALMKLQQKSEYGDWDHVGYISYVYNNIESNGTIDVDVTYPDEQREFTHTLDYPPSFTVDSEVKRFIDSEELPFQIGYFNNESLQDEAVPIDPDEEKIIIPKSKVDEIRSYSYSKLAVRATLFSLKVMILTLVIIAIAGAVI